MEDNISLQMRTTPDYMAGYVTSTWSSSDTNVAIVDQNGVVTGMNAGSAIITLTVTYRDDQVDLSATAQCEIKVTNPNASMLAYNTDRLGWSTFKLSAPRQEQSFQADAGAALLTAAQIGSDLYGYDADNQFVKINGKTMERTVVASDVLNGMMDVRGMAYDAVKEQLFVLANVTVPLDEMGTQTATLPAIFPVDPKSGYPTEAVYLGVDMESATPSCSVPGTANGLVADGSGNLYVLFADQVNAENNWIYAIDQSTVMQTGSASLVQVAQPSSKYSVTKCSETTRTAMGYNPADGKIYVAITNQNGYCFLHYLDLAAKTCISIDKLGASDNSVTATTGHFSALYFPQ